MESVPYKMASLSVVVEIDMMVMESTSASLLMVNVLHGVTHIISHMMVRQSTIRAHVHTCLLLHAQPQH